MKGAVLCCLRREFGEGSSEKGDFSTRTIGVEGVEGDQIFGQALEEGGTGGE